MGAVRDRLVRLAYRFVWNQEDAEDAVQDALVAAHEKAGSLREADKWWSWVSRIVVQRCRLLGRRTQLGRRHIEPYAMESSRREPENPPAIPSDRGESLRSLLMELPQRQHEVMVLRHLQGMPFEEIARVLDIAPATARVHARAGRETLRSLILKRDPDWFDRTGRPGGEL